MDTWRDGAVHHLHAARTRKGNTMTDDATKMKQERDMALTECERLNDTLDKLVQWSDAYPIAVFPEPDFLKAQKVLSENGMTLDAISASNMRRVIIGVREIIDAARGKP